MLAASLPVWTLEANSSQLGESWENNYSNKYKTELCWNWTLGYCPFAETCTYAHGREELQRKVKKCREFFKHGFCMQGRQCQFRHSVQKSGPKRRLPVFRALEKKGGEKVAKW